MENDHVVVGVNFEKSPPVIDGYIQIQNCTMRRVGLQPSGYEGI